MKTLTPLFLDLFTKFRILTVKQIELLCASKCKQRRIYELLNDLIKCGYVERIGHPKKYLTAYTATPEFLRMSYENNSKDIPGIRAVDLNHTLACNQAAIALMRFPFVCGLSLEHEWGSDEHRSFCYDRRPDGIIQVARPHYEKDEQTEIKYELALEVETSIKTNSRIEQILNSYRETLESKRYPCAGVIIITTKDTVLNAYRKQLEKLPDAFQGGVILMSISEPIVLNEKYFGARLNSALENGHSTVQTTRTICGGVVKYLPMKTINAISPDLL